MLKRLAKETHRVAFAHSRALERTPTIELRHFIPSQEDGQQTRIGEFGDFRAEALSGTLRSVLDAGWLGQGRVR